MSLWLDGGFWGNSIKKVFIPEIEWMRRAVFEHILPSFPNPDEEGQKAMSDAWEAAKSQPSDGSVDLSDYFEWAEDQGIEAYLGVTRMRQSSLNLATAMLWHLLEQQMLFFHMRQVLKIQEERAARETRKVREKLSKLKEFHRRLDEGGCSMTTLPSWPKVNELRLVANVVKHGAGDCLDRLHNLRPDLFNPQGMASISPTWPKPPWVDRPANGEDLYVTVEDLAAFFDATVNLWMEFSKAIEAHSASN